MAGGERGRVGVEKGEGHTEFAAGGLFDRRMPRPLTLCGFAWWPGGAPAAVERKQETGGCCHNFSHNVLQKRDKNGNLKYYSLVTSLCIAKRRKRDISDHNTEKPGRMYEQKARHHTKYISKSER